MEQTVSIQQMKEALTTASGSKFPLKITMSNGEELVRYIRGFADQQTNVVLVSETSYSLALKILEVKEIRTLEYSPENGAGTWKILQAKWLKKSQGPLSFFMGLMTLVFKITFLSGS